MSNRPRGPIAIDASLFSTDASLFSGDASLFFRDASLCETPVFAGRSIFTPTSGTQGTQGTHKKYLRAWRPFVHSRYVENFLMTRMRPLRPCQEHPSRSPPDFGRDASDFAGTHQPKTGTHRLKTGTHPPILTPHERSNR